MNFLFARSGDSDVLIPIDNIGMVIETEDEGKSRIMFREGCGAVTMVDEDKFTIHHVDVRASVSELEAVLNA